MEFATEEEMREVLGEDAKGFRTAYGYASVGSIKKESEQAVQQTNEVFIGAFVGNYIMYLSEKGTTFSKPQAKRFQDNKNTDTKVKFMNRNGFYNWKKIPVI